MNFVEVKRRSGGRVRVRLDAITAIVEITEKSGGGKLGPVREIAGLQIQLGANNHIITEGDTMETLFNKMMIARGMGIEVIMAPTDAYAHHGACIAPPPPEPESEAA